MGEADMSALMKLVGIGVLAIGVGVLVMGGYFIQQGFAAESEIKDRLADEAVTITIDDVEYAVDSGELATAQALVIKSHTLDKYGPWQTLERGSDERATLLDGLTLRNSLYLARMGLDVSELVIGLGAIFLTLGTGLALAGAVIVQVERAMTEKKPVADIRDVVPHAAPA